MPHLSSRTAPQPLRASRSRRGFALLITITLLSFLVLLLVSLASLTRVETQVAGNSQQLSQARQNALMALNIAIGQLQKYAGPDQRVTAVADFATGAPAAQTSDTQKGLVTPAAGAKQWLGVWGNSSAAKDIYSATPKPVLLNWLVSGNEQTAAPTAAADGHITAPTIAAAPANKPNGSITGLTASISASDTTSIKINNVSAVLLVGANSAGSASTPLNRYIAAPLVDLKSTNVAGLGGASTTVGRYAYWIGDEGVKAQYNLRDKLTDTDPSTSADARYRLRTPARDAIELLSGFSGYPVNTASIDSVKTSNQFRLADAGLTTASQQLAVHDVTTSSWGVLANSQSGGLRTDLTHALNQSTLGTNFSGKTILPAATAAAVTPTKSPKWEVLKSYHDLASDAWNATPVEIRAATATTAAVSPAIVQSRLMFSMDTVPSFFGETLNRPRRFFVHVYAAFVIGNPYSFPIKSTQGVDFSYAITTPTSSEWGINLQQRKGDRTTVTPTPAPFDRKKGAGGTSAAGGTGFSYYPILINKPAFGSSAGDRSVLGNVRFQTPGFTLQPGECKTFTLASTVNSASNSTGDDLQLVEGVTLNYYNHDTGTDMAAHPTYGSQTASIKYGYFLRQLICEAMTIQMAMHGSPAADGALTQPQQGVLQSIINADLSAANGATFNPNSGSAPPPPWPWDYNVLYTNTNEPLTFGGYGTSLSLPIADDSFYKDKPTDSTAWIGSHRPYADYNLTALNAALPPVAPLLTSTNAGTNLETVPPYTRRYLRGPATPSSGTSQGLDTSVFQTAISTPRWGFTTGTTGNQKVILYDVPKRATPEESPFFSIGQLQHADLTGDDTYQSVGYQPRYAVGNSTYNPYVLRSTSVDSRNRLSPQPNGVAASGTVRMFDLSYLMNTALWDGYFFSSLRQSGADVGKPANQRIAFASGYTPTSAQLGIGLGDTPVTDLSGNGKTLLPEMTAARYGMIKGAFNINSTSVDAWKALLAGGRALALNNDSGGTPAARSLNQTLKSTNADDGQDDTTYAGYRRLTDAQITTLATNIVDQVRQRGPFVSLAHFVNRTIGATSDPLTAKGAVQAAIDNSSLNAFTSTPDTASTAYTAAYAANGESNLGNRSTNSPGWLSQADILQSVGAVLSARSDTFTIRVYGDVLDPLDSTKVVSRAWCEATVQRFPDYVDTTDSAAAAPVKTANITFGRKFRVISFRWLTASDI